MGRDHTGEWVWQARYPVQVKGLGPLKAEDARSKEGGAGLGAQVGSKAWVPLRRQDDREQTLQKRAPQAACPLRDCSPQDAPRHSDTDTTTGLLDVWEEALGSRGASSACPRNKEEGSSEHVTLGSSPCCAPGQLDPHPGPSASLGTGMASSPTPALDLLSL